MKTAMRILSALLLSVVLALSSLSMAVARGQSAQGMELTLCTPDGVETVALDANGNPVPATPHLCPDCLSGVIAIDLPSAHDLPAHRGLARAAGLALPAGLPRDGRMPRANPARAPPLLV